MKNEAKYNRRKFLGAAAMTFDASELSLNGFSETKSNNVNLADATHTNSHASNNSFKQ